MHNDLSSINLTENEKYLINKGIQTSQIRKLQFQETISRFGSQLPPSNSNKPTLVLDLDHTLIQPSQTIFPGWEHKVPILRNNKIEQIQFKKRPYLKELLKECSQKQEIVIQSAAIPEFAELCVEIIDTEQVIDQRLYRQACSQYRDNFLFKDLSRLGRNLSKVVLLDDSMFNYFAQPCNGLPISKQTGADNDSDLDYVKHILLYTIPRSNDFRELLKLFKGSQKEIQKIHADPQQQYNYLNLYSLKIDAVRSKQTLNINDHENQSIQNQIASCK